MKKRGLGIIMFQVLSDLKSPVNIFYCVVPVLEAFSLQRLAKLLLVQLSAPLLSRSFLKSGDGRSSGLSLQSTDLSVCRLSVSVDVPAMQAISMRGAMGGA